LAGPCIITLITPRYKMTWFKWERDWDWKISLQCGWKKIRCKEA